MYHNGATVKLIISSCNWVLTCYMFSCDILFVIVILHVFLTVYKWDYASCMVFLSGSGEAMTLQSNDVEVLNQRPCYKWT